MNKSLKIFIACFLGAGIGTLTALQLNGYFWWVGLLVGGLIGYLSYEFKKVRRAIPKAWHAVKGWKPNKERWKVGWMMFWALVSFLSTILLAFSLLLFIDMETSVWTTFVAIFGFSFLVSLLMTIGIVSDMGVERFEKELGDAREMFKNFNPIKVYFYYVPKYIVLGLFHFFKGTIYVLVRIPGFLWGIITTIALFIKTLFTMIHSEIRLLCGIDAAIGATIGYFAGSVIIGAVSGGLFGLLNYEILSKRILHLVPSRTNNA